MVIFGMDGTSVANTCKSGSEMVIMTPSKNERHTIKRMFLLLVILAPTFSPIMVMDISAPRVKNIIPKITISAPIRKLSNTLGVNGVIEKHNTNTIRIIGTTATTASINLLLNLCVRKLNSSPQSHTYTFSIMHSLWLRYGKVFQKKQLNRKVQLLYKTTIFIYLMTSSLGIIIRL